MPRDGIAAHRHQLMAALDLLQSPACRTLVRLLERCRREGRTVALAGNGGSAATAEHMVADWSKQGGLRTIDLCGGAPLVTALANDEGYEQVFAGQVPRCLTAGDVLVLISTSGRSPNLLRAAATGRERGVEVVAFTGCELSPLGTMADLELCAQSRVPEVAEDVHVALGHAIARQLREGLDADDGPPPPAVLTTVPSGDDPSI